jgi:hypothetical protein
MAYSRRRAAVRWKRIVGERIEEAVRSKSTPSIDAHDVDFIWHCPYFME